MSANAFCDGGFKSRAVTTNSNLSYGIGHKEVVIALPEAKSIKSAFFLNCGSSLAEQMRLGESALYVGTDTGAFSAGMTKCSDNFFDSGFYSMTCKAQGKNVAIRRNGPSSSDNFYTINEVRLFQTPNLLELPNVTISAPAPTAPTWAATNLITNFTRRTPGNNFKPLLDKAGTAATWESCFKTGAAQLSVEGNKLIMMVDLGKSYFQHAVLAVEDLFNGWQVSDMNDPKKFFQNYEIYIGDSPNWADNPKCPNGPQMRTNDPKSYVNVSYPASNGVPAFSGPMWKFGNEVWCNMEGRYMAIVADLTHLTGQPYEMNLCHLAVFGAMYKRTNQVPPTLKVFTGTPYLLDIEKITADETTPITNTLDIMLRQKVGTEQPWVTFSQYNLSTQVNIAPDPTVPPGDYTIVLESFDKAGGVYSALKTDTIKVTVAQPCPISSNQITALAESLAVDPLKISVPAHKVGSAQVGFQYKYDQIVEQLAFDVTNQQLCGQMSVDLVTKHESLVYVPNIKSLFLRADDSTEPGVSEDSYLQVKVQSHSLKIPIKVEFTNCAVTSVTFEQLSLDSKYLVASGSQRFDLPKVVQKPDCGFDFQKLYVKEINAGSLPLQAVQTAVQLDHASHSLVIDTADTSFVGKSVFMTVAIEAPGIDKVKDLQVTLEFVDALESADAGSKNQTQSAPSGDSRASPETEPPSASATTSPASEQLVTLQFDSSLGVALGIPGLEVPAITKEQDEIISTPAHELAVEQLFASVPLAARLTQGVDYVLSLMLKQRQATDQKRAALNEAGGPRPPEARYETMTNSGILKLSFTKSINFPADLEREIQNCTESGKSDTPKEVTKAAKAIQVFAVTGDRAIEGEEAEPVEPIMERWELVSLRSDGVTIKVHFFNPVRVSAGEHPDQLLVQLELGGYKDDDGLSLPESLVRRIDISTQFASEMEAQAVTGTGETAETTTWLSLGINYLINMVIAKSLNLVWSLINGLLIVQMIRFFNSNTPGNVNGFTSFFQSVTSLQVVEKLTQYLLDKMFVFPEQDPFSTQFMNAGFQSKIFIVNVQQHLFMITVYVLLCALALVLWPFVKCCKTVDRFRLKILGMLLWNGYIRLVMESFADVVLFALVNLYAKDWPEGHDSVKADIVVTCVWLAAYTLLPTILFFIVWCKYSRHVGEYITFTARVGSFLAGTSRKLHKKRGVLLYTLGFFLRRLALALTLVFWHDFFWGQIAVQFAFSAFMLVLLAGSRPLESQFANNKEIFNECVTLVVMYLMMCFTPWVPEPETRHAVGFVFIALLCLFIAFHVGLIGKESGRTSFLRLRRLYRLCKKRFQSKAIKKSKKPNKKNRSMSGSQTQASNGVFKIYIIPIEVDSESQSQLEYASESFREDILCEIKAENANDDQSPKILLDRRPRITVQIEDGEKSVLEKSTVKKQSLINATDVSGQLDRSGQQLLVSGVKGIRMSQSSLNQLPKRDIDIFDRAIVHPVVQEHAEESKFVAPILRRPAPDVMQGNELISSWPKEDEDRFWPLENIQVVPVAAQENTSKQAYEWNFQKLFERSPADNATDQQWPPEQRMPALPKKRKTAHDFNRDQTQK